MTALAILYVKDGYIAFRVLRRRSIYLMLLLTGISRIWRQVWNHLHVAAQVLNSTSFLRRYVNISCVTVVERHHVSFLVESATVTYLTVFLRLNFRP